MPLLDGAPLYPVKTDEQEVARSLLCSAPGDTKHLQSPEHLQARDRWKKLADEIYRFPSGGRGRCEFASQSR